MRFVSRIIERHPILMGMGEAVAMGLSGIRAYKMRAFLTILGVVMGIMTVTGMSSIVAGLNASMARQIATLGSSTIFIRPQAPGENIDDDEWRRRKGLTMDEVAEIQAKPAVAAIAPLQWIPADTVKYGIERARDAQVLAPPRPTRASTTATSRRAASWRARRRPARAVVGDRHRHRRRALSVRRAGRQGDRDRRPPLRGDRRAAEEGPLPVPQHGQRRARAGRRDPEAGPPLQLHDGGHQAGLGRGRWTPRSTRRARRCAATAS
jgi:hypothetical protein